MAKLSFINCTSCGKEIDNDSKFCPACGASQSQGGALATATSSRVTPRTTKPLSRSSFRSSNVGASSGQGRFLPGTLLAERYRLIALLGRGGMGEVYRADDLTLAQPVALKFLPEATAHDEATLERFRNEVRIARRISHPNVCRIYDIGEANGVAFLSMEYVDGEDLGSLLRRIGRLPSDKALEIARKLCAGLSAAHDKGVLHRDLKPANIMLNSEGEVVITDFGLAEVAELITPDQVHFGTPAYMAPEQLSGKEVSTKSDIYSLGLVLYEIFTGRRAFHAETLAEIVRTRNETPTPANPSSLVRDLDPGIERVILRCLEPDPNARPASVLAVAAALPGGDPLAAALAAGETPSPQMVAAAGVTQGLPAQMAVPCLLALGAGLIVCFFLGVRQGAYDKMVLGQSPEVLMHRAQEIVARLGYTEPFADAAHGFAIDDDYSRFAQKNDKSRPNWDLLLKARPSLLGYWYRTSRQPMVPSGYKESSLTPGLVNASDPPLTDSGMIELNLDPEGRLTLFQAIPPQREEKAEGARTTDWNVLLSAAGLDSAQLQPTDPLWHSLASSDTRVAWIGTWPGTSHPLRVEAAALHGRPVFFQLIGPWTAASRLSPFQGTVQQRVAFMLLICIGVTALVSAAFFAVLNYRKKRSDPNGAFRLGLFMFTVQMALWVFRGHFVASAGTFGLLALALSTSLFFAVFVSVLYLALEPYVRRRWPQTIISWSRLLLGRIRDPLIGRDVLFGLLLGLLWIVILQAFTAYLMKTGAAPRFGNTEFLLGVRHTIGAWLLLVPNDVQGTLLFFFLIFLFRLVLRNQWLAAAAFVILFSVLQSLQQPHFGPSFVAFALIYSLAAIALVRFGLVCLASALFITDLLLSAPMTANFSHWFISSTIFIYVTIAALGLWAFYNALAGQRLWKEELFE